MLVAWPPTSYTWEFPLYVQDLYGELIPSSLLKLISSPFQITPLPTSVLSLRSKMLEKKFPLVGLIMIMIMITSPKLLLIVYLTIIPQARMGSESIAHEAEGWMSYWLRGHEGERDNCFSKIQLVGQKYRDKTTLAS